MIVQNSLPTKSIMINHDQQGFTVHDITHIDALWGIASLVVAEDFPMTPTEGFVFGGAILVHDLATPGFTLQSLDLSAFKSKTVQIEFEAKEDNGSITSFVVDDVAVVVGGS
jgi:hypothetical protein